MFNSLYHFTIHLPLDISSSQIYFTNKMWNSVRFTTHRLIYFKYLFFCYIVKIFIEYYFSELSLGSVYCHSPTIATTIILTLSQDKLFSILSVINEEANLAGLLGLI